MFLPRIIPVLLLKDKGLVKTVNFKKPRYIGDPINAVKIYNDLKADELIFLDITASKEGRNISVDLVKKIGDEAFMPFGVGGGIKSLNQIESLLRVGAEKVIINTNSIDNYQFIESAVNYFGSQSIVVSVDVKKDIFSKYRLWILGGDKKVKINFLDHVKKVEDYGAGELFLNSIDNDGMMCGYDLDLIKQVTDILNIPVIACGGAGQLLDFENAYYKGNAHALAAGSMFVYHGNRKAVLINYPSKLEIMDLFINGK